jgi:hypothetical protein
MMTEPSAFPQLKSVEILDKKAEFGLSFNFNNDLYLSTSMSGPQPSVRPDGRKNG